VKLSFASSMRPFCSAQRNAFIMKIQCLFVVFCLASANLVDSSSIIQNRGLRLRSHKSLDVKTLVSHLTVPPQRARVKQKARAAPT
jgi:hypothetical protein